MPLHCIECIKITQNVLLCVTHPCFSKIRLWLDAFKFRISQKEVENSSNLSVGQYRDYQQAMCIFTLLSIVKCNNDTKNDPQLMSIRHNALQCLINSPFLRFHLYSELHYWKQFQLIINYNCSLYRLQYLLYPIVQVVHS